MIDDNTAADPVPFDDIAPASAPAGSKTTAKKTAAASAPADTSKPEADQPPSLADMGIFSNYPGYKELVSNK